MPPLPPQEEYEKTTPYSYSSNQSLSVFTGNISGMIFLYTAFPGFILWWFAAVFWCINLLEDLVMTMGSLQNPYISHILHKILSIS